MASPKPAVIVRREFQTTPDVVSQQLRACVIGPSCQLVRYANSAEKANGFIATVSSLATDTSAANFLNTGGTDTSYLLSTYVTSLLSTSQLDTSYAKVYVEDAYLTYAHVATSTAAAFTTAAQGNYVTCPSGASIGSGTTAAWKSGNNVLRSSALPQDAALGDIIQLYDTLNALVHSSVVTGFVPASVSSSVAAASTTLTGATTRSSNPSPTIAGVLWSTNITGWLASSTTAAYDPRTVGKTVTNYTVTVTKYDGTNIDFTVSSDTGLDDASFTAVPTGTGKTLNSGLVITTPNSYSSIITGGTGTFSLTTGHTQDVPTSAGTYSGAASTTYVVTCVQGGSVRAGTVQFKYSTVNGADISGSFTLSAATTQQTFNLGNYGAQIQFPSFTETGTTYAVGFAKGDQIRISVTAASSGVISGLTFSDALPAGVGVGTVYKVRLSKKATVEVPAFNVDGATANWYFNNSSDSATRTLVLKSKLGVKSSLVALASTPITAGKVYLQFRAFQALNRQVGAVNSLSDITTQLGTIDPDNYLAYGVYKAWSNANGATVHFIPTVSQTLNGTRGFADALSLAKGNRNCYSLVPLTTSSEIWDACVAHAKDESDPAKGRFRIVWIAPEIAQHSKIMDVDSAGNILAGSSSFYSTGKYSIDGKTLAGGTEYPKFVELVQPGDYVRTKFSTDAYGNATYTEYQVVSVVDNDTLVISAPADPAMVYERMEIYRDLSSQALAKKYVAVAGGYSSERVFAVVPDRGINGLRVDGLPVKNWYVACAFAGLRSGSRPQQPLSNVELTGFDGDNITPNLFDEADLDILRDGGAWVVRNTEEGKIYSERQLSTSTLDLYRKEQSVTCNVDSISFSVGDSLRTLVGRVNITPETQSLVEATLRQTLGVLSATNGAITVGPQLIDYKIVSVTVPATAQDTLLIKVQVTLPLPMNVIDITLVI